MPVLVLILAIAAFAQGTSEFMLAGLLSPIAADLDVSPAVAGTLTSAFAAGMVVGAPLTAVLGARLPARATLTALLIAFVVVHVVGALADSFPLLLGTRIVAALANAGFLAIALATVRRIVPAASVTRAVSVLLGGITLATVVGVPLGAALAQLLGWRSTFWAVAALCVPAVVALLADRSLRVDASHAPISVRAEARDLARRAVLGAIVLAVLVNAATFGVFTYLGLLGERAGLDGAAIPLLLAGFGVGAFLGVTAAGRWAAARERAWIRMGTCAAAVAWAAFATLVSVPWAVVVLAVTGGLVSFAVGSALIARIVREASGAPVLGGAAATVALNAGALAGPIAAGAALSGIGAAGVPVAAAAFAAVAAVVAIPALRPARSD